MMTIIEELKLRMTFDPADIMKRSADVLRSTLLGLPVDDKYVKALVEQATIIAGRPHETRYYFIYNPGMNYITGSCTSYGVVSVLEEEPNCGLLEVTKREYDIYQEED